MHQQFDVPPLNVHIGINTGRISIGDISGDGTGKMDYTVIGEPVELAEVLEDISEDGEICPDRFMLTIEEEEFEVEIEGLDLQLKAKAIATLFEGGDD